LKLNYIYTGDCIDILRKYFPDKCIDFVITSPPFKTYVGDRELSNDKYYSWLDTVLNELERVTKQYSLMFNSSTRLIEICRRFNPIRVLIWYKGIMKYSYRYEPIFIFRHNTATLKINKRIWSDTFKFQAIHKWLTPYQNPVALYRAIVKMITRNNEIVLDPFMGSGTLALACLLEGRPWVGIEINPEYVEIANNRINDLKNKGLSKYINEERK